MKDDTKNLIAGSLSGFTVRFLTQPLDVIKIRFQLQVEDIKPSGKSYYTGLLQAFIRIYKEEGVYGLWKGHVPAQFLSVTFCGAQFGSFYAIENLLVNQINLSSSSAWVHDLIAGSVTGVIASTLSEPLDVMRTRLIAQGKNQIYSGFLFGMCRLLHEEGLLGFWRGLGPCLISVVPQTTVYFTTYEQLKRSLVVFESKVNVSTTDKSASLDNDASHQSSQTDHRHSHQLNWHFPLWAGGFSGLLAKTIVYPLDLAKKRLEIRGFEKARSTFGELPKDYTPSTYKNINLKQLNRSQFFASFSCLKDIVKEHGIRGLYKGWIPSALKATLTTGLMFWFYERYSCLLSYYC
ncbi:unnamed protein product [Schistosoma turkestanicum]|nr:unnamed protein product [Schistosoma turkestanicum]